MQILMRGGGAAETLHFISFLNDTGTAVSHCEWHGPKDPTSAILAFVKAKSLDKVMPKPGRGEEKEERGEGRIQNKAMSCWDLRMWHTQSGGVQALCCSLSVFSKVHMLETCSPMRLC